MTVLVDAPADEAPHDVGSGRRWRLRHTPGLDGLRAVAVVATLLYHAELPWVRGGFLGVSQFFTLSGFLITSGLLEAIDRDGGVRFKRFWTRRVRRLWPASLAALAGIVLFGATVASGPQRDALPEQVAAALAHVSNWLFVVQGTSYVDQFAAPSPVQHFWSLSLEEQFYLLLPIGLALLLRVSRSRRVLAGVVALTLAASLVWTNVLRHWGAGIDRIYYGTDTRMSELLVGVLLAVVLSAARLPRSAAVDRFAGWFGAVALCASIWLLSTVAITESALWSGGITVFALGTAAVIVGVLAGVGPLRILAWAPLVAIGRVSYGLYLYHFPIYLWLTSERTGLSRWPLLGLRVGVTAVAAVASYRLLEQPIRSGRALRTGNLRFAIGPLVAVAVLAGAFALPGTGGSDQLAALRADGDGAPSVADRPVDPVTDVLVITDGPGRSLADHVETIAADDDTIELVPGGSLACGELTETPKGHACTTWRDRWPALIEEHDPDVVLLVADDWSADEVQRLSGEPSDRLTDVTREALGDGLDILTANGAPVVWARALTFGGPREKLPYQVAMNALLRSRDDLRSAVLPNPGTPEPTYLSEATTTVLESVRAQRRPAAGSVPRVMVVGDSQARALGEGLVQLESETGGAVIQNVASPGCGIANDGEVRDVISNTVRGPYPRCASLIDNWEQTVVSFDPEIVVVLSSLLDVEDRRLDGEDDFATVGDASIDDYLLGVYERAADTLSSKGAKVVWLQPPCVRYESPLGGGAEGAGAYEPRRMRHLADVVLPKLRSTRPDDVVLYGLDDVLCPGGRFLEKADGVDDIRADGVHLTPDGGRWVAKIIHRDVIERYGR